VFDVIQTHAEELTNVLVIQLIEHALPLPSGSHEVHLPQPSELMRDSRLAHAHFFGQDAHAKFLHQEGRYDAHPAGIAQSGKQLSKLDGYRLCQGLSFHEYMNK
jgi:hypothetical protein